MAFTGKASYGDDSGFRQLHCDLSFSAGTTAVASEEPKLDLTKIHALSEKAMSELAQSFSGVPFRVDRELRDMEYYISVSPALLAEIEKSAVSEPKSCQPVDKLKI